MQSASRLAPVEPDYRYSAWPVEGQVEQLHDYDYVHPLIPALMRHMHAILSIAQPRTCTVHLPGDILLTLKKVSQGLTCRVNEIIGVTTSLRAVLAAYAVITLPHASTTSARVDTKTASCRRCKRMNDCRKTRRCIENSHCMVSAYRQLSD